MGQGKRNYPYHLESHQPINSELRCPSLDPKFGRNKLEHPATVSKHSSQNFHRMHASLCNSSLAQWMQHPPNQRTQSSAFTPIPLEQHSPRTPQFLGRKPWSWSPNEENIALRILKGSWKTLWPWLPNWLKNFTHRSCEQRNHWHKQQSFGLPTSTNP